MEDNVIYIVRTLFTREPNSPVRGLLYIPWADRLTAIEVVKLEYFETRQRAGWTADEKVPYKCYKDSEGNIWQSEESYYRRTFEEIENRVFEKDENGEYRKEKNEHGILARVIKDKEIWAAVESHFDSPFRRVESFYHAILSYLDKVQDHQKDPHPIQYAAMQDYEKQLREKIEEVAGKKVEFQPIEFRDGQKSDFRKMVLG